MLRCDQRSNYIPSAASRPVEINALHRKFSLKEQTRSLWDSSSAPPPSTPPAATPPAPSAKAQRVAEYTGPRLTKAEADAAYEDSPITYLFGLGDGSVVIDGHWHGHVHQPQLRPQLRDQRGRRPRLDQGHPQHRPRRGDHLRLLPLRRRSTTKPSATAARRNAAAPCTRRKRSAAARRWPKKNSSTISANAKPTPPKCNSAHFSRDKGTQ